MTFGAGHIQDMNNRMRQNREQRPSNKPKFKGNNRDAFHAETHVDSSLPKFKTVSPEELDIIKTSIREQAKIDKKKHRTILTTIILICLASFIILIIFITKS